MICRIGASNPQFTYEIEKETKNTTQIMIKMPNQRQQYPIKKIINFFLLSSPDPSIIEILHIEPQIVRFQTFR